MAAYPSVPYVEEPRTIEEVEVLVPRPYICNVLIPAVHITASASQSAYSQQLWSGLGAYVCVDSIVQ